uniref:Uncharacterized protein n=1 Tax=Craspedostauros australis TaxID=1486917 RepID=A0A7R9ZI72_9STRA
MDISNSSSRSKSKKPSSKNARKSLKKSSSKSSLKPPKKPPSSVPDKIQMFEDLWSQRAQKLNEGDDVYYYGEPGAGDSSHRDDSNVDGDGDALTPFGRVGEIPCT